MFFFIDRDIMDEPNMDAIDDVVLSYTFFRYVTPSPLCLPNNLYIACVRSCADHI